MGVSAFIPLADVVDLEQFPLAQFVPAAALSDVFVESPDVRRVGDELVIATQFWFNTSCSCKVPGLGDFALEIGGGGASEITGSLILGERSRLELTDFEAILTFPEDVLRDQATNSGTRVSLRLSATIDGDGISFSKVTGDALPPSFVAGTELLLQAEVEDHADGQSEPSNGFSLLLKKARLTIPASWLDTGTGSQVTIEAENVKLDAYGISGTFNQVFDRSKHSDVALFGFAGSSIQEAGFTLSRGQFVEASIRGALSLAALGVKEPLGIVARVSGGRIAGDLQLPELEDEEDGYVDRSRLSMTIDHFATLAVSAIRLEEVGRKYVLFTSGSFQPEFDGSSAWPPFEYDELGIASDGEIIIPNGSSIALSRPHSVDWKAVILDVSAFRLTRPEEEDVLLELQISAGVQLVEGIPAAASVEGLVIPLMKGGGIGNIRLRGLGLAFGVPGAFTVAAEVALDGDDFRGKGHLDLPALDIRMDIFVERGTKDGVHFLFMAAEADVLPGGIPIGSTGLNLYAISGLLAYNMKLDVPDNPVPEEYFILFKKKPRGLGRPKWVPSNGDLGLGLGVVIGTADDGTAFNARGMLLVTLPELAFFLEARAQVLRERKELKAEGDEPFYAFVSILPDQGLIRFDIGAEWHQGDLFEVKGEAGAQFNMRDPTKAKFWLGKEEAPVTGNLFKLEGAWLLEASLWLEVDLQRQLRSGYKVGFNWRAGGDGLYVELGGSIAGGGKFSWSPAQFEGGAYLKGHATLSVAGLSLGVRADSGITAAVAKPTKLTIPLNACITIDLLFTSFEICLHFTFDWSNSSRPELAEVQRLKASFEPRFWSPPDGGWDGVVTAERQSDGKYHVGRGVQPLSEIVLDFERSVRLSDQLLKQTDLNGYDFAAAPQQIGEKTNYELRTTITELVLEDDQHTVRPWGTWTKSPSDREATYARPRNSNLRLYSSSRFGRDGSLTGGGAENSNPDYCSSPLPVYCVSLAGTVIDGNGRLNNGWCTHWRIPGDDRKPSNERRNEHGILRKNEDEVSIDIGDAIDVNITLLEDPDHPIDLGPVANSSYRFEAKDIPFDKTAATLCYSLRSDQQERGLGDTKESSGRETWTDGEDMLLYPGRPYTLRVTLEDELLSGGNPQSSPVKRQTVHEIAFQVAGPPLFRNSLQRAIVGVYPADGARSIHTSYELVLRAADPIVMRVFELADLTLTLCLENFDGGRQYYPLTKYLNGPITLSSSLAWWLSRFKDNPCVGVPLPGDLPTGLIAQPKLAPLTRYNAKIFAPRSELVKKGVLTTDALKLETAASLYSWSFITSRTGTFKELLVGVSGEGRIPFLYLEEFPQQASFDAVMTAAGLPLIAVTDVAKICALVNETHVLALLLECAEPMDDAERLMFEVGGTKVVMAMFNHDRTRVVLQMPGDFTRDRKRELTLTWSPTGERMEDRRIVTGKEGESEVWKKEIFL